MLDPTTPTSVPTQTRHPWRATARTVFAAVLALLPTVPSIVAATGVDTSIPWAAAALGIVATVTRVLALPGVNRWLADYQPWLAADPHAGEPGREVSARTKARVTFLGAIAYAIVLEVVYAFDKSPDTEPLTDLTTKYVPAPATYGIIAGLAGWLFIHFARRYRRARRQ